MTTLMMPVVESTAPETRSFAEEMIAYIRDHFEDLLGADVAILDEPDGLERLSRKYLAVLREKAGRLPLPRR